MWWFNSVLAISFVTVFLSYRDWLDLNKQFFYRVTPGPCKLVIADGGSEDLTHIGDGMVIISSGLAAGLGKGSLKLLNVNTSEVTTLEMSGIPSAKDFMTNPHGLSSWTDEKGQTFVYVITHPPTGDRIEVFQLKDNYMLQHQRSITDPSFRDMNDLVVVGRDKFYITLCVYYSKGYMQTFELLTRRTWGGVMYFDGTRAKHVASGLFMPNGINVSRDKKIVYVSESGTKNLIAYKRSAGNVLTKLWEKYADTFLDNIEVDPDTGDLWIGCHPLNYKVFDYLFQVMGYTLPSQVLRYKMEDNAVSEIEEIYADDGSELDGSTVATYVMGKLVVGTIVKQTLVCDVEYLSK